jgi:putative flippase GtrA
VLSALVTRFRSVLDELAKFGTVGFLSLLIDVAVFNVVLAVLPDKPLTARVTATVVATANAFVLNRHWSFKHRERGHVGRDASLFVVINAVGMGISLLAVAVSHYALGFESRLADNIASYGPGLVLGTSFRFWAYRRFVWVSRAEVEEAAADGDPAAVAVLEDVRDGTLTPPVADRSR